MFLPAPRTALLLAGAVVGYGLILLGGPARASLRDGARCLRRFPQLWALPAVFGLGQATFVLVARVAEATATGGAGVTGESIFAPGGPRWDELGSAVDWRAAAVRALLPAAEGAAGVFNAVVATFPLSAVAALGFLVNWRGYAGTFAGALRRRFGAVRGGLASVAVGACALTAAVKPVLLVTGGLAGLGAGNWLPLGATTDFLGFVWEYLLGVGVQVYLIALTFAWVRGLGFDPVRLRQFALRRGGIVAGWAAVVIVLGGLGINGPLAFLTASGGGGGNGESSDPSATAVAVLRWTTAARWVLAAILLAFATVQITLVFRNVTVRRAVHEHWALLRQHGARVGWFTVAAAVHFFLLGLLDDSARQILGGGRTFLGTAWGFAYAALWGALGGWLLAGWVCLFRRLSTDRADAEELVPF